MTLLSFSTAYGNAETLTKEHMTKRADGKLSRHKCDSADPRKHYSKNNPAEGCLLLRATAYVAQRYKTTKSELGAI